MQHSEIKGFTDQSEKNKAIINRNKESEERLLRITDELKSDPAYDQRFVAMAVSYLQIGFMCLNRAVFQPQRIELPEDAAPEPEIVEPPVYVGRVFQEPKQADGSIGADPEGTQGQKLIAIGHHWYVKHDWENYQRRLKGEPELPDVPTDDGAAKRDAAFAAKQD